MIFHLNDQDIVHHINVDWNIRCDHMYEIEWSIYKIELNIDLLIWVVYDEKLIFVVEKEDNLDGIQGYIARE